MATCKECDHYEICLGWGDMGAIELNPDADKECVRFKLKKIGTWLINSDGYYPYCSVCGEEPHGGKMTKHCPNCGAEMSGEE